MKHISNLLSFLTYFSSSYTHANVNIPSNRPPLPPNWWMLANWTDYWTGSGDYSCPGYNSCYRCCVCYEMEEEDRLWLVGLRVLFYSFMFYLYVCMFFYQVYSTSVENLLTVILTVTMSCDLCVWYWLENKLVQKHSFSMWHWKKLGINCAWGQGYILLCSSYFLRGKW